MKITHTFQKVSTVTKAFLPDFLIMKVFMEFCSQKGDGTFTPRYCVPANVSILPRSLAVMGARLPFELTVKSTPK